MSKHFRVAENPWSDLLNLAKICQNIEHLNAGMSRDKCGAAAAAGIMASIAALQPQGVKV